MEISGICISKVLCFIWSTSYCSSRNGHLVAGTGLDEILGDTSIDTTGLQTANMDVNHIHKARYSVQLSVVLRYACLKKAHKASNSVLTLFSWAEERSSSSSMFKDWMLIMKFQIRSLRIH